MIVPVLVLIILFTTVGAEGKKKTENTKKVLLHGDSLMNKPYNEFDLSGKIDQGIKYPHDFTYINTGVNGNKIADILARTEDVLTTNAITSNDIVLLFWDSDCSDIDEKTMTSDEVRILRANFTANLNTVLGMISKVTPMFAVAGPELLGEGPIGEHLFSCSRFWGKEDMLDDYREMTRTAVQSFASPFGVPIPYIDMRKAFQDGLPWWWKICSGYLTKDGEHPNDRGTQIEAAMFAEQINLWLADDTMKADWIIKKSSN